MARRGHLSTKQPGVKLRPAPAATNEPSSRTTTSKSKKANAQISNNSKQKGTAPDVADEDSDEADTSFDIRQELKGESKPLQGKVICMTGIRDGRTELQNQAQAMGARVETALTLDVTHLIAESVTTAKYKCAIEYGKLIMDSRWITSMHKIWVSGETANVEKLTERHRLAPLHNLSIAITAFPIEQASLRKEIINQIVTSGAHYKANFDDQCTHLLVGPLVSQESIYGNAKIVKADEFRRKLGDDHVFTVWSEWLEDSLHLSGALDESKYDVASITRAALQRVRQTVSVETSNDSLPTITFQLLRQNSHLLNVDNQLPEITMEGIQTSTPRIGLSGQTMATTRKHTLDHDQSENVMVKRRKLIRGNSMADLLGIGINEVAARSRSASLEPSTISEHYHENTREPSQSKSLANIANQFDPASTPKLSLSRSASFTSGPSRPFQNTFAATVSQKQSAVKASRLPSVPSLAKLPSIVQEVDADMEECQNDRANDSGVQISSPAQKGTKTPNDSSMKSAVYSLVQQDDDMKGQEADPSIIPIFEDLVIALVGFMPKNIELARGAIEERKGTVIVISNKSDEVNAADWIICPIWHPPDFVDLNDPRVVSDRWIERCLFLEEIVNEPDHHFACRPIKGGQITSAGDYNVICSGFDACDEAFIKNICRFQGINFGHKLIVGKTTHCIAQGVGGSKAKTAQEINIEVVGVEWLINLIRIAPQPAMARSGLADKSEKESHTGPLSDCVVVLSKKISTGVTRQSLSKSVEKLGGRMSSNITSETTHYVHSSLKSRESFKDFRLVKDAGKHIVHPKWIEKCESQVQRVDERGFPHTYQENKALTYTVSSRLLGHSRQSTPCTSLTSRARTQSYSDEELPAPIDLSFRAQSLPHRGKPTYLQEDSSFPGSSRRTLAACISDQAVLQEFQVVGKPLRTSDPPPTASIIESADPDISTPSNLAEEVLQTIKSLFDTSSEKQNQQMSKGQSRKTKRPNIQTRDSGDGTNNLSGLDSSGYIIPAKLSGGKSRLPFDMTQLQPTQFEEVTETEHSMRITVVDPVAVQAKARLLKPGP